MLPESKGQVPKPGERPTYVNTQQIDAQVLAALQAEAENVTKGMAAAAKESPQKDLFDMSKTDSFSFKGQFTFICSNCGFNIFMFIVLIYLFKNNNNKSNCVIFYFLARNNSGRAIFVAIIVLKCGMI